MPDLRLPSPPQSITAPWLVPNYTPRWRRHVLTTWPGLHSTAWRPGFKPATCWLQVQRPNHSATHVHYLLSKISSGIVPNVFLLVALGYSHLGSSGFQVKRLVFAQSFTVAGKVQLQITLLDIVISATIAVKSLNNESIQFVSFFLFLIIIIIIITTKPISIALWCPGIQRCIHFFYFIDNSHR